MLKLTKEKIPLLTVVAVTAVTFVLCLGLGITLVTHTLGMEQQFAAILKTDAFAKLAKNTLFILGLTLAAEGLSALVLLGVVVSRLLAREARASTLLMFCSWFAVGALALCGTASIFLTRHLATALAQSTLPMTFAQSLAPLVQLVLYSEILATVTALANFALSWFLPKLRLA